MTDGQYIESMESMFDGPDESTIECRTVKVVTARKEHMCMCPGCLSPGKGGHNVLEGERAVVERAICDGSWGACYVCLPCLKSWYDHCEDPDSEWCIRQERPEA